MPDKMPQCVRCHGANWIDLGSIGRTGEHLFQCGGGPAGCEPEEVSAGCMRVIRCHTDVMKDGTGLI